MKFLIAGFGSIGRRHFRNLLTLGERDIVFLRSNRSTLPDDEIAEFPVETEIQAALAHQPDAVIIATPTALHLDIAIPAARQGCHLFIEKPISHSLERLDEFQAALARGGGKAFTAFQFRFHPGLHKIKDLLDNGAMVDGFGVGTEMVTSRDDPVVNSVYKLIEHNGQPKIKISEGKITYPGKKQVYRIYNNKGKFKKDILEATEGTCQEETGQGTEALREGDRTDTEG